MCIVSRFSVLLVSCLVCLVGFGTHSQAQEIENGIPKIEWQKKIDVSSKLAALDYSLMGESIDLHTGGISFSHTDIELPGNSDLDVSLRRTRNMGQLHHADVDAEFGDWALVVPRINAIVGPNSPWKKTSGNRCSGSLTRNFPQEIVTIPPKILGNQNLGGSVLPGGQKYFYGPDYSNGIEMVIPGQGSKPVLKAWAGTDFHRPSSAVYTTSDAWYLTCIPVGGNEGFEATSPTGAKYAFDKVIIREAKELEFFDHDPDDTNLDRWRVSLMATRVEDVHGNWVEYDYNPSGHLTTIRSYDGRKIDLTYSGDLIKTATANGRTWTYNYGQNSYTHRYWEAHTVAGPGNKILHEVERPDTSKWSFGLDEMTSGTQPGENCAAPKRFLIVGHPQGSIGQYFIEDKMHRSSLDARTWDPDTCGPYGQGPENAIPECDLPCTGSSGGAPVQRLKRIGVVSVTEKIIMTPDQLDDYANGNATDLSRWIYTYEEDNGPLSSSSNDRTNWTKVKDPLGNETTYFHKWHRERDGGSLIRQEMRTTNGALVKSEEYEYELPTYGGTQTDQLIRAGYGLGGAFEDNVNVPPCNLPNASSCFISGLSDDPMPPAGVIMHNVKHIVEQDGDIFTTENIYSVDRAAASYSFGNPIETRSWSNYVISNESKKRITQTTYEHNTDKWILGLHETVSEKSGSETRLVSTYDYDLSGKGQLITANRYGEDIATYAYHPDGTVASVTDALNRKTEADDWYRGKPRLVTFEDGSTIERGVDDNGWITSQTDARGYTTSYTRDEMGRLKRIDPSAVDIGKSPTIINYHFGSVISQTIDKGFERQQIKYDTMLRPIKETLVVRPAPNSTVQDPLYSITTTQYDALGRVKFKSLPDDIENITDGTNYFYDALGRPTSTVSTIDSGVTTTYAYLDDNCTEVTDPEGQISGDTTTTCKDGYGGPGGGDVIDITQPEGIVTTLGYNGFGELLTVNQTGTQGGDQTQSYFYDDITRRLCGSHVPEAGNTLYEYDAAGQLTHYAKGASGSASNCDSPIGEVSEVKLTYDALGRPKTTEFLDPATPDIWRDYDANGNVTHVFRGQNGRVFAPNGDDMCLTSTGANCWFYEYDEYNRLKVQDLQIDDRSFEQKYYYNGYGYMYRQTLPTGREIFITRDGAGRTLGANFGTNTFATGFKYHPNQQIQEFRYGNGVDFDNYQNNLQQLSRRYIRKLGGDTALDVSYTYDDNGRITDQKYNILAGQNDPNNRTYGYDGLGRLTSAVSTSFGGTGTASFSYDALGNLKAKTIRGRTVTNTYDDTLGGTNRLTQSAESAGGPDGEMTRAVAYDDRGNITTLGGLNFIYDMADQPRSVSGTNRTGGTVTGGTYAYDGNLKRVKSVINGVTRYNVYDKEGRLAHVEERDVSTTDYLHAAGMTLARIKNTGNGDVFTYMHPDHLGSASAGTKEDGSIAFTEFHTPFGEALVGAAANDNQSDFTGHIRDKDIGLSYMQARYMDPNIGRFASIDPMTFMDTGEPGMFNRYTYTLNDPVNMIDPDGRNGIVLRGGTEVAKQGVKRAGFKLTAGQSTALGGISFIAAFGPEQPIIIGKTLANTALGLILTNDDATPQATPTPQGPISPGAAGDVPDLGGMAPGDATGAITDAGFGEGSTSDGGYTTHRHGDGSRITVKPDGTIIRTGPKTKAGSKTGKGYRPRVDSDGQPTEDHNPPEKLDIEPKE